VDEVGDERLIDRGVQVRRKTAVGEMGPKRRGWWETVITEDRDVGEKTRWSGGSGGGKVNQGSSLVEPGLNRRPGRG
jgi:hypothetical protein